MNKQEWYENTSNIIMNDLESFYAEFYPDCDIVSLGPSGYRLNPCPVCGHSDCATVGEAVNCFSCGWKGTHISAWYEYCTEVRGGTLREAITKLENFTQIKYPQFTNADVEEYEKEKVTQNILKICEDFYHDQLIKCTTTFQYEDRNLTPLDYLLKARLRKMTTIEDFKIGFSMNFLELHKELISLGYTKQQIKEARAWVPEGLFIYYYKNPLTKDIVRINTKNPFNARIKERSSDGNVVEGEIIKGYSVGKKEERLPLFTPKFSFNKPFVVVEGENDLGAIYENGADNACCIGGNLSDEQIKDAFKKAKKTIYLAYDNDDKGEDYTSRTNDLLPDKDIRQIIYPESFKDPDDYYKSPDAKHMDILTEEAKKLETVNYEIHHNKNIWTIQNRHKKLEFIIDDNKKGQLVGTVNLYIEDNLVDREVDKDLTKCKANKKPFNFFLHDKINEHFNTIEDKSAEELAEIYWYSSKQTSIIKKLARMLHDSQNDENLVNMLKVKLKTPDGREDVVDSILKEANEIQNQIIGTNIGTIPKIKVSQYFNCKNNDAYFYFMNYQMDGDSLRRLPFLLRNDKYLIRLDLLKRKDPQCLLLIDNKYELPLEVSEAIMDAEECSLTQEIVYKYIDGEIKPEELEPRFLTDILFGYYKKFYYTTDESLYAILALYTMLTYYYELFDSIPYLFINGQKGSGKSVIGAALHLLCFNAKMATDISDASLFRITSLEGGTLILDEMENLTSRTRGAETTMGTVLKGGYKRSSNIYRSDMESNIKTNKYDSYGPKIIINILGLDDIIIDRCIPIDTYKYTPTKETKREDPKSYLMRLDEIREVTGRCCLSALEHFREVNEIKNSHFFETDNARLSEILTPILAMARFVDSEERKAMIANNPSLNDSEIAGKYEKFVHQFYQKSILKNKCAVDRSTPEGIIKFVIAQVAKELYGMIPEQEKEYTIPENHKYSEPIKYDIKEGWFELNVIHLKCFIEENIPGETVYTKIVTRWVKTCFDISYLDIRRSVATIENDELIKEFKGNTKPKVNTYKFYFRDFISSVGDDFLSSNPFKTNEVGSNKNLLF